KPNHVSLVVAIGPVQAIAFRPRAPRHVDVREIAMRTLVNDGDLGKVLAVREDAALEGDRQDIRLRNHASGGNGRTAGAAPRPGPVVVEASDALVQAYELLGRNHALLERLETILHADVVVRQLGFRVAVGVHESAPLRLLRAPIRVT